MSALATSVAEPAELLRRALGQFATGVTVVTTVDADGRPLGTTATAVASLSLDPPLVLVCLKRDSTTRSAILGHRAFAINVLAEEQEELSANFARRGTSASWRECEHDRWASGCPRLDGALASIDCTVEDILDGGDHEIVIGRVRDAGADHRPRRPLLHWRGRYAGLDQR
jgi:flavin reductase (DIM6/NTAB) family NADH-FMN oxidoreductase RutF